MPEVVTAINNTSLFTTKDAYVTVSPIGYATTGLANNGANYGPDTPGTTTSGIQEAINSLPTYTFQDGGAFSITGRRGWVQLLGGVFTVTTVISIPSGTIKLRGVGKSTVTPGVGSWPVFTDFGGTAIVGTSACTVAGVVRCNQDSNGFPSTTLDLGDMDIRIQSPGSGQGTGAPPVCQLAGWLSGTVSNLQVMELTTAGAFAGNMGILCDINAGAGVDNGFLYNVFAWGGYVGLRSNRAHLFASNIFAGFTSPTNSSFHHALELNQNTNCWYGNLHVFSTNYGLSFYPYVGAGVFTIHGIHFESCTHYILGTFNSGVGMLVIEEPIWDVVALNPATDIAASLALGSNTYSLSAKTGIAVFTRDEVDARGFGTSAHVKVPNAALVAGASPYTFPSYPFECVYVCTTVGGMTGLTLNGVAVSIVVGVPIFAGVNSVLIATWVTTAPTFNVIPI